LLWWWTVASAVIAAAAIITLAIAAVRCRVPLARARAGTGHGVRNCWLPGRSAPTRRNGLRGTAEIAFAVPAEQLAIDDIHPMDSMAAAAAAAVLRQHGIDLRLVDAPHLGG
jgi:hypothetical protein